jgi:Secretion system C-terminal sorting domain
MKNSKHYSKSWFASLAMIMFSFYSFSATYTTIADGAWGNTTDVWSLDGISPCGCTPGNNSGGNDITVNHIISTTINLDITGGSTLTVTVSGELSGANRITINASTINIYGNVSISKLGFEAGSIGNVVGAILSLSNRVTIDGSVLTIDGGLLYLSGGNLSEIQSTGTLNLINGSRVNLAAGNLRNDGTLFIDGDCCVSTSGNWVNEATGNVTGTGSAMTSAGNMTNNGTWDVNINWCSAGSDTGMPTAENCAAANTICDGIVLPIELIGFDAEIVNDYSAEIAWSTASETNNDYFIITKSCNGLNWDEIDRVNGAGNSTQLEEYFILDRDLGFGTSFYRLIQVDNDGTETYSDVVSVNNNNTGNNILIYPNPSVGADHITISNLDLNANSLSIVNTFGKTVFHQIIEDNTTTVSFPITGLNAGIYFVRAEDENGVMSHDRLIISK